MRATVLPFPLEKLFSVSRLPSRSVLRCFVRFLSTETLTSTGFTRFRSVLRAPPSPHAARPASRELCLYAAAINRQTYISGIETIVRR